MWCQLGKGQEHECLNTSFREFQSMKMSFDGSGSMFYICLSFIIREKDRKQFPEKVFLKFILICPFYLR